MKKQPIALFAAAVLIFAVAGCTQKAENTGAAQLKGGSASAQSQSAELSETALLSETCTVAQESVTAQPTASGASASQRPTRRPTITTIRPTSPNHLPPRQTTTQRTTIVINVPTRAPTTARSTTLKATTTRPPRPSGTTAPVNNPTFDYGGTLSQTVNGATDSVKIVSHTCQVTDRGTFAIMLTFEVLEKSGTRENIRVGYNCYDKNGTKLNDKPLYCVVPLSAEGEKVIAVATATLNTAEISFVSY